MERHQQILADTVRRTIAQRLAHLGRAPLPPDADLFEEGILDSVVITELIAAIEAATGREIDFIDVDPDQLATVEGAIAELGQALS